jgi:hypothetical protein
MCFEDYADVLHILEGLIERDNRILVELYFSLFHFFDISFLYLLCKSW